MQNGQSNLVTKNDIEKVKSEIESTLTFRTAVLGGVIATVIGVQF